MANYWIGPKLGETSLRSSHPDRTDGGSCDRITRRQITRERTRSEPQEVGGDHVMVCQERAPAANGDFFKDAASSGWFKTLEMAYTYVYATAITLTSREVDHAAKGQNLHE